MSEDGLTSYELERSIRIRQNEERMASLGLLQCVKELAAQIPRPSKRRRAESSTDGEPVRRSLRQQGVATETCGSLPTEYCMARKAVLRVVTSSSSAEEDYHDHNAFRLSSMSDKALRLRIRKITNVAKMKSFVQVLRHNGNDILAEEAEAALQLLLSEPRI